jgi:transposase
VKAVAGQLHPSPGPPGTAGLDRYRQKLTGYLVAERNRLHKVLDDCGLRLGTVVSDINCVTAQCLIGAVIEGRLLPTEMAELAQGRLAKKKEELQPALESDVAVVADHSRPGPDRSLDVVRKSARTWSASAAPPPERLGRDVSWQSGKCGEKSGRTAPGNKYVWRLLCEAAHAAVKTTCQFKGL